jgi:hypothetical protein
MARSKGQLRSAAGDLYYEWDMFCSLSREIGRIAPVQTKMEKALLEAFLIHARNLYDFLYTHKGKKHDVLAQQFFPSPDVWFKTRGKVSAATRNDRNRMDKKLAHLSYTRQTDEAGWRCDRITDELRAGMERFLATVSPELLSEEWAGSHPAPPVDWSKPVIGSTKGSGVTITRSPAEKIILDSSK